MREVPRTLAVIGYGSFRHLPKTLAAPWAAALEMRDLVAHRIVHGATR
ncbi:MAG: hypothetical protein OXH68_20125 [Gammaproteobacteria bacterium]|nr:hypothetical protein [Gammaproteobacteria bacterium]